MNEEYSLAMFLSEANISLEDWESSQIEWDLLKAIGKDHLKQTAHLEGGAELIANIIQRFEAVHSVRWRVKDPIHLMAKIVRKRAEKSQKYDNISIDNYGLIVTDLVGIRALHLFKDDCFVVDQALRETFSFRDTVIAYVRKGDNEDLRERYKAHGFDVQDHPKGYRSVHYVLNTQPVKNSVSVEVQVRTIFEEGWSEIDHKIRYPNFSNDVQVAYLLEIFNRMAGNADEIGGFTKTLAAVMTQSKIRLDEESKKYSESLEKIESLMATLAENRGDPDEGNAIAAAQSELSNLKSKNVSTKSFLDISLTRGVLDALSPGAKIDWIRDSQFIKDAIDATEKQVVAQRAAENWERLNLAKNLVDREKNQDLLNRAIAEAEKQDIFKKFIDEEQKNDFFKKVLDAEKDQALMKKVLDDENKRDIAKKFLKAETEKNVLSQIINNKKDNG